MRTRSHVCFKVVPEDFTLDQVREGGHSTLMPISRFWQPLFRHTLRSSSTRHNSQILRKFETMPPRKRAAVEVIEEEKVDLKSRRKPNNAASSSKKAAIAEVSKGKATSKEERPKKIEAAKSEATNETKSSKATAAAKPGKSKKSVASTSAVAEVTVEKAKNGADETTSSPSKKKRETKIKKGDANGDGPVSLSAPPPGGSKMDTLAAPEIPKNTTIDDPVTLENAPKKEGTTRLMSWNIISLNSSMGKGLMRYIEAEQADVVVLTETKVSRGWYRKNEKDVCMQKL
jgi:hypothetical protein